ncbi:MAG: lipopolysaccharide assembly protein LapA domain-containing protein [Bacteroidota bacterium]
MQRSLIIGLIAALILTVFATSNAHNTDIDFLWASFEAPVSLILIGSIIIGVILGIIFSIPSINKQSRMLREKNKEIENLKKQLEEAKKAKSPEDHSGEKSFKKDRR